MSCKSNQDRSRDAVCGGTPLITRDGYCEACAEKLELDKLLEQHKHVLACMDNAITFTASYSDQPDIMPKAMRLAVNEALCQIQALRALVMDKLGITEKDFVAATNATLEQMILEHYNPIAKRLAGRDFSGSFLTE